MPCCCARVGIAHASENDVKSHNQHNKRRTRLTGNEFEPDAHISDNHGQNKENGVFMTTKRRISDRIHAIASSDRISGLIMLGFACLGLVLANLPWTTPLFTEFSDFTIGIPGTNIYLPVAAWAEDGILTLFFLTVGLDLRQELTTGSLANPKAAAVPMLCAVGGMMMPPILFYSVVTLFYHFGPTALGFIEISGQGLFALPELLAGWAIPTATDIAFSLAVLALFAKGLPGSIRAFLMTLATVDDLLAIIVIAVFFSALHSWYWFLGIAVCAFAWWYLLRRKRVPWVLVAVVGLLAWLMMFEAGIHPTLVGVLVGLLTPSREIHGESSPRAHRYHDKLQPLSSLVALPIFALFATGVHIQSLSLMLFVSPVVVGIIISLVVGKPLGVMMVAWISTHLGHLSMPKALRVRDLFPASCACGIGFTVSFLIASLAYADPGLSAQARFAVLCASLIAAAVSGVLLSIQAKKCASLSPPRSAIAVHALAYERIRRWDDGTEVVTVPLFSNDQVSDIRAKQRELLNQRSSSLSVAQRVGRAARSTHSQLMGMISSLSDLLNQRAHKRS